MPVQISPKSKNPYLTSMKHFLFAAALFTSVFSFSQVSVNMVKALMTAQESAWNNGEIESFMDSYWKSDSLKFIGSKGVTYGWQRTLDNYKRAYPTKAEMGILKFTLLEATELAKDAVYVIGKWELEKENPVSGHFTLLWRKIRNQWVIVSDHTS
jgi:ketosteroid isomerase-like protein